LKRHRKRLQQRKLQQRKLQQRKLQQRKPQQRKPQQRKLQQKREANKTWPTSHIKLLDGMSLCIRKAEMMPAMCVESFSE
jgi:hypothetical protein